MLLRSYFEIHNGYKTFGGMYKAADFKCFILALCYPRGPILCEISYALSDITEIKL